MDDLTNPRELLIQVLRTVVHVPKFSKNTLSRSKIYILYCIYNSEASL